MSVNKFSSIQINLASPERILKWSHGEVKKPETINYRSQKPERDGLFCERIFGPSKDWECYCGKYKKVRYKGVVCDRCGVEITKSSVRRERMGHIELAAPVAHIWYLRGIPSRIGLLLDVTPKQLEEVVYFVSWIVTDPKDTKLEYKRILSEKEYRENVALYGADAFTAQTGAAAIKTLLEQVDLEKEYKAIQDSLDGAQGEKRKKLIKRLDTVNAFRNSDNKPEWMVLSVLPVIPPDLRPMLQLDGGRFATSDLNDLYRRVITRNNRLKKLLELGTPAIIVQNEKRMLQEAVDALIDNGRRSKPITGAGGRALKSLSHSLKGKQGRFRQNLLGKRVDFSGRSVIAVGPDLKMYQCGIPREMAIQLFKPYVINEIVNREIASNHKTAEKLIDKLDPRVWDIVEDVIEGHPVLLNRAPTLHRLGIQAYLPKLVEGRAIRLHPLVCPAFNADFDGDQMAVHVPLSEEARAEAYVLMLGSNNILGPKDGKPIVTPSQDMVLGNFYLTMEETKEEFYVEAKEYEGLDCPQEAELWRTYGDNEGHAYRNVNEVLMAYENKQVHLHTRIALMARSLNKEGFSETQKNSYLVTTVGKVIFNNIFPKDFPYINEVSEENFVATPDKYFYPMGTDMREVIAKMPVVEAMKKKDLGLVIGQVFKRYSTEDTSEILDEIKNNGFKYSTVAGITVSLADIQEAPNKKQYVDYGKEKATELMNYRNKGKLTMQEWERHLNKLWDDVKKDILIEFKKAIGRKNPINMMATSGARGNDSNFTQLAGMRGLMAKPSQSKSAKGYQPSVIEVPIYSSFREGLNVSEFFTSTHGVRKGLTDTALKTAESGYLTRRLVDVAQDVVVKEEDCGTDRGYWVEEIRDRKQDSLVESMFDRLVGRYAKDAVYHPETKALLVDADEFIDEDKAQEIIDAGVKGMFIRSAFTCQSIHGVCKKCYGRNMATGKVVEVGESVGIMAAQSIGEPGTQLTMRTFHTGGVATAGGGDITQGLPRVEELFEARTPKGAAVLAKINGTITEIAQLEGVGGTEVTISNETESIVHKIGPTQVVRAWLGVGSEVIAGDKITEGQVAPKELLEVAGVQEVQQYILKEVKKVYASQGIDISDKHIEVMVRQMLRKVVVLEGNDTSLIPGMQISLTQITKINRDALLSGGKPATFTPVLLGISKASVETDSFLSAASFQETTKVLTDASIKGKKDNLIGLKENVIIGKLIPAGTGLDVERETSTLIEEKAEELRAKREAANAIDESEEDKLMSFVPKDSLPSNDVVSEAINEEELSVQDAEM
ncbi:DNA-directed RNA polymerase subunit beta' [Breznakia sp. PF5-3]|uniref:DNA-directed RNA polymerase subunit beta' n=1 Tax=unclassified Breznakia TaxID=2623764 RepID=UPI00240519B8|nr:MULTISPECIES: DNA-directed RNA polymerase subunit beta' [unclassified Breznakia]MDF9825556.1 DNA-directed RNA polymerase subunit beta' [Breznakia sp. PM6-1]MDF9836400.1 DNA-directed RNA polymerase subunit beta' [Breznakia sp. PF5-3]MDF9838209.1 DNA-directed RNA polymerase subunit beta' [Breznakia sp. PFB2-8]MDF9860198.1 DNA-directed RNA polymerase subunit beta' [Breznakia sp. PH5-24]